ncbi:MAG: prevent-host-death protein [Proteobacteria bacterium]|nr:prevent-host-death protein [Pseudomonadota bacterium]
MKTATLPPIRIAPSLREQVEALLADGETLSAFIETAVRDAAQRRQHQSEFIARGLASREQALATGAYLSLDEAIQRLRGRLDRAREAQQA